MQWLVLKPNVYTFIIHIKFLGTIGKVGEASNTWTHRTLHYEADVMSFTTLMDTLCINVGRLDEASELLNETRRRKCKPDFIIYNTLIHKYGDSRDINVVHWYAFKYQIDIQGYWRWYCDLWFDWIVNDIINLYLLILTWMLALIKIYVT